MEAAQSAVLRSELYNAMNNETVYGNLTAGQVATKFGLLRGILGAGVGQGLTATYDGVTGANLIAADAQGLAFARNPAQVSHLGVGLSCKTSLLTQGQLSARISDTEPLWTAIRTWWWDEISSQHDAQHCLQCALQESTGSCLPLGVH